MALGGDGRDSGLTEQVGYDRLDNLAQSVGCCGVTFQVGELATQELSEALEQAGVSVWFSEKAVPLGSNLMREIDRGLSKSRAGLVLVTSSFIKRIKAEGVADKELSALLARDLLVPIVHGVTYDDLREESPLLASRSGLDTAEDTMEDIAAKISELVSMEMLTG